MKSYLIISIVLFICSGGVFGQANYKKSIKENKIDNGVMLSIRYWTPSDSNMVYISLVNLDSNICYAGYESRDRFPHEKDFNVSIMLKECSKIEQIELVEEVKFVYKGSKNMIYHSGYDYDVANKAIHNITVFDDFTTKVSYLKTLGDLDSLSSSLKTGLEPFLLNIID